METLTTVVSSTSMKVASITEMVTIHGFTSGRDSAAVIAIAWEQAAYLSLGRRSVMQNTTPW
jgi:hypothetical protein